MTSNVIVEPLEEIVFKFKSGKQAKVFRNTSGSWTQYGKYYIDPSVLNAMWVALSEEGYLEND